MAKDFEDGVWRTIGGRRVFIKDGQSLSDAMKESGKFSRVAKNQELYKKIDEENEQEKGLKKELDNIKKEREKKELTKKGLTSDEIKQGYKDVNDALKDKEDKGIKLSKEQIEAGNKLNQRAEEGVRSDVKSFLSGKEDYDGSREDFIRDLSDNWNVDKDKVEKILDEERKQSPRNFKTDRPNNIHQLGQTNESDEKIDLDTGKTTYNWEKQIKENNDRMEKDVTNLQNQINDYRNKSIEYRDKDALKSYQYLKEADNLTNQYYERFRQNERENAKIKAKYERPEDTYVQTDAYAGYKDKFNETWGKDGQKEKVVSAKMYTNDEFMEHLEDANWHGERKQLLDAKLTNQELAYIKDRTKVSAWGVENLIGKEQVDKLIKEAKSQNNSINNSLRQKAYQKYLKEHPASKISFEEFKDMNKK